MTRGEEVRKLVLQKFMKRRMRYSEEEMQQFMQVKGNRKLLGSLGQIAGLRMVVAVLEAHGCFCRHKPGQEFAFGMDGGLLTGDCPASICIHLISPMSAFVQAAQELLMAGQDPAGMAFTRYGCFDVGVGCGGLGKVVCEVRVESSPGK